ncbi:ankyrin repeat domain-containing protein [Mitsuaria sp. 7]|uniref:ankyrin repeat domain-containing protein n=1 Tax=Mitsuaria sp. 7 TaxID=1658665 RepID=UPI0008332212|nr:ankyrin repeat domain-containing protein [Mitsuaria sp. 7]
MTKTTYSPDDWFEAERLHRAAHEGDITEMKRLIAQGYDVNLFDDLGNTPLHEAVRADRYRVAEWLLDHGASVNANEAERIGETPLCFAVQRGYPEMVALLLKRGADPDINGWMGLTARIRAQKRADDEGREMSAMMAKVREKRLR